MGNRPNKPKKDEEIVGSGTMSTNMLRLMNDDVFKKYKVVEVLGTGSMGFVAKARVRTSEVGGTAINRRNPIRRMKIVKRISSRKLADRRETPAFYALKSIQVDRVSKVFLKELKNEMNILRSLVSKNF